MRGCGTLNCRFSSPICNSSGAVAAVLCFVFLKQAMTGLQLAAVALICLAVLLLSLLEKRQGDAERAERQEKNLVKYQKACGPSCSPILYCIIDGLGTFADALCWTPASPRSRPTSPTSSPSCLWRCARSSMWSSSKSSASACGTKSPSSPPPWWRPRASSPIFAIGGNAVVAAPLISSYCVFSVLWSRIFLKEKLSWKYYAVIGLAVVGIAILGME